MRVVVQRVKNASCVIDGKLYSQIDTGYLLLVGFTHSDTLKEVKYLAKNLWTKLLGLIGALKEKKKRVVWIFY